MASLANNEFGWNLLSALLKDHGKENLFLSPFSISVALAMTSLGAKDETAAGMEKALFWKTDSNAIHKEFQRYVEFLQKPNEGCILRSANRIYVEEGYPILETFMKQTKEFYLAEPVPAHFRANANAERVNINTWVEKQTEDKIKNLLQEGILNGDTRMVLVNAIYFKGQWAHKFDESSTMPKDFYISSSRKKSVPMMNMKKDLPYYKAQDYAALELPYKGGNLSMVIFLPDQQYGLQALEKRLTIAEIQQSFQRLRATGNKIQISIPKFEICSSFTLKDTLSKLGMDKAFSISEADFSGMTGSRDLCISEVVHKAFLKVNEEGSEAAAATAAVMMLKCAMPMAPQLTFIADHPFVVVIRDKSRDMVLFMGHVTDPEVPK